MESSKKLDQPVWEQKLWGKHRRNRCQGPQGGVGGEGVEGPDKRQRERVEVKGFWSVVLERVTLKVNIVRGRTEEVFRRLM